MAPSTPKIKIQWAAGYVLLSYVTCMLGAFSALDMLKEARVDDINSPKFLASIFFASLALGVSGIWCMHYVGMEAANFDDLKQSYNVPLMILSALFIFICSYIALYVAMVFARSKNSTSLVPDNDQMINEKYSFLRTATKKKLLRPITRRSLIGVCLGGFVLAVGVGLMHWTGLLSMNINAIKYWHWYYMLIIVIAAVILATAGIALLTYIITSYAELIAANIIAIAACSLHYSAMYSVSFHHYEDNLNHAKEGFSPSLLGFTIAASLIQYSVTFYARHRASEAAEILCNECDALLDHYNNICDNCKRKPIVRKSSVAGDLHIHLKKIIKTVHDVSIHAKSPESRIGKSLRQKYTFALEEIESHKKAKKQDPDAPLTIETN